MDAFIGEIRPFGFTYAPDGWMLCQGQLLPIQRYSVLFSVLGFRFGGDGRVTFGLPDLRGIAPVGAGTAPGMYPSPLAEYGGAPTAALSTAQIPVHSHTVNGLITTDMASAPLKGVATPDNTCYLSNTFEVPPPNLKRMGYSYIADPVSATHLGVQAISMAGSGQVHNNMQPYLVINYCICVEDGEYPVKP